MFDILSSFADDILPGIGEIFDSGPDLGDFFDGILTPGNIMGALQGGLGYYGQEQTNQANAEQAELNRQFQAQQADIGMNFARTMAGEQMHFQKSQADTEIQRRVADLKAAGLNPMLSYNQGASTTSGATAQRPQPGGAQATMGNPTQAGIGALQSASQIANIKEQNQLLRAQVEKTEAETVQAYSSAGQLDAQRDNIRQEMQSFERRMEKLGWETRSAQYRAGIDNSEDYIRAQQKDLGIARAEVERIMAQASEYSARAKLLGLEVPEAIAFAAYWNDLGKSGAYIEKGTDVAAKVISSATRARQSMRPTIIPRGARIK